MLPLEAHFGDPARFRLGVEAARLGLAYEERLRWPSVNAPDIKLAELERVVRTSCRPPTPVRFGG